MLIVRFLALSASITSLCAHVSWSMNRKNERPELRACCSSRSTRRLLFNNPGIDPNRNIHIADVGGISQIATENSDSRYRIEVIRVLIHFSDTPHKILE